MSYCRWSSDDFQCDLYVYEHVDGYYVTWVAPSRYAFKEPLPDPVPWKDDGWVARENKVDEMVETADRVPTGGPHDGEEFHDKYLPELKERLLTLRGMGYKFPDYALERIDHEIAETIKKRKGNK
jgi:hypothetical protein